MANTKYNPKDKFTDNGGFEIVSMPKKKPEPKKPAKKAEPKKK